MAKKKKTYSISDDTPILPHIVAEQVVNEVERYVDESLDSEYVRLLVTRANEAYNANASFRKKIRASGNRGRDQLYVFMRHWLAAALKDKQPSVYRQLPQSFAVGHPLENPGNQSKKTNPMGAEGKTALGAGLGSLGGTIVGGLVGGLPGAVLGSAGGGAAGGYYTAPEDRKNRGAVGGGVGGIIFGPIGAAVGGYIGGGKPGKKGNPHTLTKAQSQKVLRLRDGDDIAFGDIVWTRMDYEDPNTGEMAVEYKVSPHGGRDDFDTDAYWVYKEELKEEFDKAFGSSALNPRQTNPQDIKKLKSRLLR